VLLLQTLEQREAILDLLQARRGRVDVLRIRAQEEREILELRLDRVARVEVGRELRIERGELADASSRRPERRQRGLVPFVERRVGLAHRRCRRSALARTCRVVRAPRPRRLRRGLVDLGELEGEELGARGLLLFAAASRARSSRIAARRGTPARRRRARRSAREFVEQIEMRRGIEQHLVLVLAVEIDERSGDSRSAALVTSAPSTNARLRPCDETRGGRSLRRRPAFEDGLDGGGFLAGPDEVGAGAAADEQPTAPTRMDLPAPVSPVRTLKPGRTPAPGDRSRPGD
jgi:hypothetical protein